MTSLHVMDYHWTDRMEYMSYLSFRFLSERKLWINQFNSKRLVKSNEIFFSDEKFFFRIDPWVDIEPPSNTTSSFADRDLTAIMHVNENLLLEAQKESSRAGSKGSRSDR